MKKSCKMQKEIGSSEIGSRKIVVVIFREICDNKHVYRAERRADHGRFLALLFFCRQEKRKDRIEEPSPLSYHCCAKRTIQN